MFLIIMYINSIFSEAKNQMVFSYVILKKKEETIKYYLEK